MSVVPSQHEVGLRVIAGLIDVAAEREGVVGRLSASVTQAVAELDPGRERNTDPTWWHDLPPWVKLDAVDRLRKAHDDLLVLEGQAAEVVAGLRAILGPSPVGRISPVRAHEMLCGMADRRIVYLGQMRLAERRVRPKLANSTGAALRAALREVTAGEERALQYRDRLGRLLHVAELIVA